MNAAGDISPAPSANQRLLISPAPPTWPHVRRPCRVHSRNSARLFKVGAWAGLGLARFQVGPAEGSQIAADVGTRRPVGRSRPEVGSWLPVDPRVATWVRVASSFGCLGSRGLAVQQPPRQPAATTPSESAPAGGTATAIVPVVAQLPAAGRRPLRSFHFASVVIRFECRIDRQSTPTPAPASRTLAESSP